MKAEMHRVKFSSQVIAATTVLFIQNNIKSASFKNFDKLRPHFFQVDLTDAMHIIFALLFL